MAKLVACGSCPSTSDGNPLVLPMAAGFDAYNLERIRAAGPLLLGAALVSDVHGVPARPGRHGR
ncbi:hypothetical protein [Nonomuraea jabiensis]|uniref:hypothetical protein n=1 Tax=Nonomuraea jabiensis TaxID=882448 RepID=UPI0036C78A3F